MTINITRCRAAAASLVVLSLFHAPAIAGMQGRHTIRIDGSNRSAPIIEVVSRRSSHDRLIAFHAEKQGVPLGLAHAVISYESQYRADAVGNSGEIGLMQLMPATARGLGFSGELAGLHDPDTNLRFGMKYLAQAYRLGGGDICATILRYNAGLGAKRMTPHASKYCAVVKQKLATP